MRNILVILLLCSCTHLQAQQIARFTVKAGNYTCANLPVSTDIDTLLTYEGVDLFEVKAHQHIKMPFQLEPGRITWQLSGTTSPNETRIFELQKRANAGKLIMGAVWAIDTNGVLSLGDAEHMRMKYHAAVMPAPAGVDTVYQRSGFIHPLYAPDGQVLTAVQPKDHYHHYGIWNPWTHTSYKGKEVDFWNLQKKEGSVRFVSYLGRTTGNVWSGFKALHAHMAGAEKAMDEVWDVRLYSCGPDSTRYSWDITSTLSCATLNEVTLLQYRYGGGFGWRATQEWKAENTALITDAGKTRNNADSTRARWVKVTGTTAKGKAGVLILCAADNFDAPQPLRVWADNAEHGELMLNYSPTKMKAWKLGVGQEYRQRYRIVVFNGELSVAEAEDAWQAFVHPPVVSGGVLRAQR
jgi:hypothetical protein